MIDLYRGKIKFEWSLEFIITVLSIFPRIRLWTNGYIRLPNLYPSILPYILWIPGPEASIVAKIRMARFGCYQRQSTEPMRRATH